MLTVPVTVNFPFSSLFIYYTHLAKKEFKIICSWLNLSYELQPSCPKLLIFMVDTCEIQAGKKTMMELKRTKDKYVGLLMVQREYELHLELE